MKTALRTLYFWKWLNSIYSCSPSSQTFLRRSLSASCSPSLTHLKICEDGRTRDSPDKDIIHLHVLENPFFTTQSAASIYQGSLIGWDRLRILEDGALCLVEFVSVWSWLVEREPHDPFKEDVYFCLGRNITPSSEFFDPMPHSSTPMLVRSRVYARMRACECCVSWFSRRAWTR